MNYLNFKPKFIHAAFVQVSGLIALGIGWLSGGEYVALSVAALGVYIGGNVLEQQVQAKENVELKTIDAAPEVPKPRADG